jgi:hypothetical protein
MHIITLCSRCNKEFTYHATEVNLARNITVVDEVGNNEVIETVICQNCDFFEKWKYVIMLKMINNLFAHDNKNFSLPMRNKKGNSTRIIDRCIQELFTKGITYVYDGRGTSTQDEQTEKTIRLFVERLKREHPKTKYVSKYGEYDHIWCYKVENRNL